MTDDTRSPSPPEGEHSPSGYRPPTITYLGTVANLTQKTVGRADGSTLLGVDIGSI
jgi:hypothetical protein